MSSNPMDCITKEKVEAIPSDKLTIIDVRSDEEYLTGHIPGAKHIPIDNLEKEIENLSVNSYYVTACGKGGGRSIQGAELLESKGFNASWLCGGTLGWI